MGCKLLISDQSSFFKTGITFKIFSDVGYVDSRMQALMILVKGINIMFLLL